MSLGATFNYRWLFLNFLRRELSGRYVGSISGWFWVLLQPLALLAIYGFVFATVFKVTIPELHGREFIEFVALGLWPWLAFQEGVQRGALIVQGASGLIKKVSFPHELLVYASVASTFLIHLCGFLLVVLVMGASGKEIYFSALPVAIFYILLLAVFTSGLAMFFAALQVFVRDIEHFLSPVLMICFYATPVLYTINMVPEQMRSVMAMNPMGFFISGVRDALLLGEVNLTWQTSGLVAGSLAAFVVGRMVFRRLSPYFEDFI